MSDRLPPNDKQAERSVVSALLADNLLYAQIAPILQTEDFYHSPYRVLFTAILELLRANSPADLVTVKGRLTTTQLTDVGGVDFLIDLWDGRPVAGNGVYYAEIVAKKAVLRRLIHVCGEIAADSYEEGIDPAEVMAEAERKIFDVFRSTAKNRTFSWEECIAETNATIDRRSGKAANGETEEGLKTGWDELDTLTGGLHKRELIILAARPSVGKTLAALNIIDSVATNGGRVFFASLEQGRTEIVMRLLVRRSGVNSHKFRTGRFSAYDASQLVDATRSIQGHRVWVNDGSNQSLAAVVTESRRLQMAHGLDMVVVDYLGLMDAQMEKRNATRTEEIGRLTRGLKRLAKDLDVVVVCLCQLNRGSESGAGRRPRLSDLRDSGEIEQDADTVFMLHRPEKRDPMREIDQLTFLIEKQRNGPVGWVDMEIVNKTMEIREIPKPQKGLL